MIQPDSGGRVIVSAVSSGWAVGMQGMLFQGGAYDQVELREAPQLAECFYVQ